MDEKRIKKNAKGYTLIELLIGLSIIGIIFSFGFVSFREFSRRQALNGAKKILIGQLRVAQELALSGEKPNDPFCNSPNSLKGYNFRAVSNINYTIEASCTGGDVETKNTLLDGDITISAPSTNPILFKVLGQGTNIDTDDTTITLTQTITGNTREIVITKSGEIQ